MYGDLNEYIYTVGSIEKRTIPESYTPFLNNNTRSLIIESGKKYDIFLTGSKIKTSTR